MEQLKPNQGGPGRHKCCFCSFQKGLSSVYSKNELKKLAVNKPREFYTCPHGNVAPSMILNTLQESQGGVVRHRCATCAFWRGLSSLSDLDSVGEFSLKLTTPTFIEREFSQRKGEPQKGVFVDSDRNLKLGYLGELAVINYERQELRKAGKKGLADKIEHISMTQGDAFGYDVRSYNSDGSDKWIEVKTTTGTWNSLFHISENQISVSELNPNQFHLYRVYDFDTELRSGSLYTLNGDVRTQLTLLANSYKALPKH